MDNLYITEFITKDLALLTVFIIGKKLNPDINTGIKIKTNVQYENKSYAVELSIKEII